MNIYQNWNFWENPFQTTALPPDKDGKNLLVGRDSEINLIKRRIFNPPAIVCVEGANGVGKTSLVNVAIFDCYEDFFYERTKTLYIPCLKTFQLNPSKDTEEFIDAVYFSIAQTLIKRSEELKYLGFPIPETSLSIDKWLNSPHLTTYQATAGPFGLGRNSETNTTEGFQRSGFREILNSWLNEIFPAQSHGSVVCVIDNLELLETSAEARRIVEKLRDELFSLTGTRWMLCGALGIIKSIASTARMEGVLHRPIEVSGIQIKFSKDLFEKRIQHFSNENWYLPLIEKSFSFLYEVLNQNIRNSLNYADQYCMWTVDNDLRPETDELKDKTFAQWLSNESNSLYDSIRTQLRPRALRLFNDIIGFGGATSPSEFELFGFNSVQAMRPQIAELESTGLVISTIDDTDNRRKSINVTPKGWFVSYAAKKPI